MPDLIFIRGIPGSGKSTYAQKLYDEQKIFMFTETDDYWIRPDGYYDFNFKRIKEAHEWNVSRTEKWMKRGSHNIAVANTFTQLKEMQKYLDLADKYEYTVRVIRCIGKYGSVHDVPEVTIKKMLDRFEDYEGETIINEPEATEQNDDQ